MTTIGSEYRSRILDAARECFIEAPHAERMHALIAERAGLSRPTVYKYVGDQQAIKDAVLERETLGFIAALGPTFARRLPLPVHFRELVVAGVLHLRTNTLFQILLDTSPATVTKALTVDLAPTLRQGGEVAEPLVTELFPATADAALPLELLFEWGIRLTLSLATTSSPYRALETADELREHVDMLFRIGRTSE